LLAGNGSNLVLCSPANRLFRVDPSGHAAVCGKAAAASVLLLMPGFANWVIVAVTEGAARANA
jgi:hypothetical protein